MKSPAHELRRERLACDPVAFCRALGIDRPSTRQRGGLLVCCPAHDDRSPSCSVFLGDDGTLRAHCFGCDFSADAIGLIQAVRTTDFRGAITELAEITGRWDLIADQQAARTTSPPCSTDYPDEGEVADVWSNATYVADDAQVADMLRGRALDPERIDDLHLARVIPKDASLPPWATSGGQPWTATVHRLILPVYDASGRLRSLRAWRVVTIHGDRRKRLPPFGHRASGLVLADPFAGALLRAGTRLEGMPHPPEIIITEGEPDFLTWVTRFSDADENAPLVLGVFSGAWTDAIAERIPDGSHIFPRTHDDLAGQKYAAQIEASLGSRCLVHHPKETL